MTLKHCLLPEIFISEWDTHWDSPSLPLGHSMPMSRECRKRNKMAWPGATLHTKLLLVHSQCLHPEVCWRAALVFPLNFGGHVPAVCPGHSMDYAVPSMFRSFCCFGMPPFVNAHIPTAHPGLVFRKLNLSICEKKGPSSHPRLYTQI